MKSDFKNNFKNRVGERNIMKNGEEAEIVEYRESVDITVKFIKTGELVRCRYGGFKRGEVKSRLIPSVYNVGIIGLEKTSKNDKMTKSYKTWNDMLRRCYDKKYHERQPTYKDVVYAEEWLFYPNFKKWYEDNYYEVDNQRMNLDKDILNKGNKIYSPENCVFVPQNINSLFVKKDANRGELPIGVRFDENVNKYLSRCSMFNTKTEISIQKHLGLFNTSEEAFQVYKKAKEENIKLVADYYKNIIPKGCIRLCIDMKLK